MNRTGSTEPRDERVAPPHAPASPAGADGLAPADEAAVLAAPELPAPPPEAGPAEPGIGTLWWLIGAVVVLAIVYFMVR